MKALEDSAETVEFEDAYTGELKYGESNVEMEVTPSFISPAKRQLAPIQRDYQR